MNTAEYARMFENEDRYWWFVSRRELVMDLIGRHVAIPDPVIVGSPCAAYPPTTAISLRDGKRLLAIAPQVPRDEAGNVVGKGDMRAQIEQVGKNVGACLQAGGATVKDIAFTVSFVTEPAEFDKHADLRLRYFGSPSPQSETVPTPQLSSPDFMLQVEAYAVIK